MNCKFCNSKDCSVIKKISSPYNLKKYYLYICNHCKSFFFNKDQHPLSICEFYDDLSKKRENFPEQFSPNKSWQRLAELIFQLMEFPLTSILDISCRTGDFLLHFDSKLKRVMLPASTYINPHKMKVNNYKWII